MIVSLGDNQTIHERAVRVLGAVGCDVRVTREIGQLAEWSTGGGQDKIELVIVGGSEGAAAVTAMIGQVTRACPDVPVVAWSRDASCGTVVAAIKAGASQFLAEPFTGAELHATVGELLDLDRVPRPVVVEPAERVGWEPKIAPLLEKLRRVDTPLLIQGETGVGKENLARKIHGQSLRSDKIFLKVNCAALPAELVESELFGYERGAFTGAFRTNRGKFEAANNGTMLLDEIGDMDLKVQAKLLQVLQDQEFIPLGARHPVKVDVRVIAATHRNLDRFVEEGKFREDLYYRLNVINLMIPPLRERPDEIPHLAHHFLQKHSNGEAPPPLTSALLKAMYGYAWPGNIRELENLMRRYFVLGNAEAIVDELRMKSSADKRPRPMMSRPVFHEVEAKPEPVAAVTVEAWTPEPASISYAAAPAPSAPAAAAPLPGIPHEAPKSASSVASFSSIENQRKMAQSEVIIEALNATLWNRKEAAARLQIEYKALLYKMKKLNIGAKPSASEDAEEAEKSMSAVM